MNRKLSFEADFPELGYFDNPIFDEHHQESNWLKPYEAP